MPTTNASPASTTRYQIYCPRGLTEDFEAYVQRHNLTFAEAGRRAIRLLLKADDGPDANGALENFEQRIATTLSQHGERQREDLDDIRRLLRQALGLE